MEYGLWNSDLDEFYKGEIDVNQVETIQTALKVTLPESYIKLMHKKNGFYLTKKYYPVSTPNSWANNSVHVDSLYGLGENPGILDNPYLRTEWGIRSKKIIIISAEPPTFICLDYRKKKNPSVIFIDVDENQEIKLAENFEDFLEGLVEEIAEEMLSDILLEQQIQDYYKKIDDVILNGKPAEIDRLLTKILSTNNELIRYLVEKMRRHEKPKVHFNLLLYLICCAEGLNKGTLEDEYLLEVLNEFSTSKNKDVKEFAVICLEKYNSRL